MGKQKALEFQTLMPVDHRVTNKAGLTSRSLAYLGRGRLPWEGPCLSCWHEQGRWRDRRGQWVHASVLPSSPLINAQHRV